MIVGPRPNYRATDHCHRFRISQNTKINEILPEPDDFPLYAYDAKSFDDVRPRVDKPVLLSDVVGMVTMVSDVIPSKTGDQPRRHIYIKNESDELAMVTLWGEQAKKFDAEGIQQISLQENVFLLFVGMNVTLFKGMLGFKGAGQRRYRGQQIQAKHNGHQCGRSNQLVVHSCTSCWKKNYSILTFSQMPYLPHPKRVLQVQAEG
ncbi:hypothetical protein ACQ4PT_040276 [Festuca glaucescens]